MLHIDSTQFGEVIVDGIFFHQVLIIGDKIEERDYKKLQELFDTSHEIGEWEIEKLLKGDPQVIIVGTGQNGAMIVEDEIVKKFRDLGIDTIIDTAPKAIGIYNEQVKLGKRVNALMHTTC
jgi:hypothetical protein